MHGFIREGLENLLSAKRVSEGGIGKGQELQQHLSDCDECGPEVAAMRTQAELLRALRAPEEVEPTAGFYARVLQRIEQRTRNSIWAVFIYSPFGKRLALASATIAVLLGSFVLAEESNDGHLTGSAMVAQEMSPDAPVVGDQAQQRDAVLVNFVSYEGSAQ
jgi:anti-sigma factor RsiW